MALIDRRSQSTMRRCDRPASAGCEWASMKPGRTVFPPRSSFRTPGTARFMTSAFFPTAKNLLRDIATASATGSAAFIVTMWPLWRIKSGFSCSNGKRENAATEPKNSRRVVPSVMGFLCWQSRTAADATLPECERQRDAPEKHLRACLLRRTNRDLRESRLARDFAAFPDLLECFQERDKIILVLL